MKYSEIRSTVINLLCPRIRWLDDYVDRHDKYIENLFKKNLHAYIKKHGSNVIPVMIYDFLACDMDSSKLTIEEIDTANHYNNLLDVVYWNHFIDLFVNLALLIQFDKTLVTRNFFSPYIFEEDVKKENHIIRIDKLTGNVLDNFNKDEIVYVYTKTQCLIDAVRTLTMDEDNNYVGLDLFLNKQKRYNEKTYSQCIRIIKTYKAIEKNFFELLEHGL